MEILDCGHVCVRGAKAIDLRSDKSCCYDCATLLTKADMIFAEVIVGYLSKKTNTVKTWYEITTWNGDTLVEITEFWGIGHNFPPYKMIHWSGVDICGRVWYGKAVAEGMCTIMHKSKNKRKILKVQG